MLNFLKRKKLGPGLHSDACGAHARRAGVIARLGMPFIGFMALGCPQSVRTTDEAKWTPVELPAPAPKVETEAEREQRLVAKRAHFEAMRNKFQAAFVQEAERTCQTDADCTLTPAHCCTCSAGGTQDAVSAEKLPDILLRRAEVCREIMCPQMISQHPSCSATRARCELGVCKPDVDPNAAAEPEFGLGIESLPN